MTSLGTSVPATWRGQPVPKVLAMWFDQLAAESALLNAANHRYIDVTLTCGSSGAFARPPQILFK